MALQKTSPELKRLCRQQQTSNNVQNAQRSERYKSIGNVWRDNILIGKGARAYITSLHTPARSLTLAYRQRHHAISSGQDDETGGSSIRQNDKTLCMLVCDTLARSGRANRAGMKLVETCPLWGDTRFSPCACLSRLLTKEPDGRMAKSISKQKSKPLDGGVGTHSGPQSESVAASRIP